MPSNDCSIIAPAKLRYCLDRDLPFKEALYVTSEMFWENAQKKIFKQNFQHTTYFFL